MADPVPVRKLRNWEALGAHCLGRADLFAPHAFREPAAVRAARVDQALALCATCPALNECRIHAIETRPHGVIIAGMDLTGDDPSVDTFMDDTEIYWDRICRLIEALGLQLTDYQMEYLKHMADGTSPTWAWGGARNKAARDMCDFILAHPEVNLTRKRRRARRPKNL